MSRRPADQHLTQELMDALDRIEKELDKAYDGGAHHVTVRFGDAVAVCGALNALLKFTADAQKNQTDGGKP